MGRTPNYFLHYDKQPIGPPLDSDAHVGFEVLFGFSDKRNFDLFLSSDPRNLQPYPIATLFLSHRLLVADNKVKLVALDAANHGAESIIAATFEEVLLAKASKLEHCAATHRLVVESPGDSYRVQTISSAAQPAWL